MIKFVIQGETPSKKNNKILTRSGKIIPGKAYQAWHKDAMVQVYGQISRQSPCIVTDRVRVSIAFHHGDLRRRDSDNGTSSILDLMVDCGILKDDCGDYNEGVQNAG